MIEKAKDIPQECQDKFVSLHEEIFQELEIFKVSFLQKNLEKGTAHTLDAAFRTFQLWNLDCTIRGLCKLLDQRDDSAREAKMKEKTK